MAYTPKEIGLTAKANRRWMTDWVPKAEAILPASDMDGHIRLIAHFIKWNGESFVCRSRIQEYVNFILINNSIRAAKRITVMLLLIYEKLPQGNPARKISFEWEMVSTERPTITEEQYRFVRRHVVEGGNKRWDLDLLCDILWYTGLSRSDACNLKWEQIDLDHCTIVGKRGKTEVPYHIPFERDGELHRVLLAREDPRVGWVSEKNHTRITNRSERYTLDKAFTRACRAAGMGTGAGTHSFRRAFVSRLINTRSNDHDVIKITGHRTTKMLDTYHRATPEKLRGIIDLVTAHQQAKPQVLSLGGPTAGPAVDQPGDRQEVGTVTLPGGVDQPAGCVG